MSVTENVVLGATDGARSAARRRHAEGGRRGGALRYPRGSPGRASTALSVGEQQRVEILKALYRDCRVLILDEPTAVLVPQEVDALFATLRRLRDEGMAIVFISHKLREVREISSRVTVLRRGVVVGTGATAELDDRELATLMVGRPTMGVQRPAAAHAGAVALRVQGLSLPGLSDVSLEVAAGEILGVAGVSGNGQNELVDASAACVARPPAGSTSAGSTLPARARRRSSPPGWAGSRRTYAAVVGELTVAQNLALEHLREFRRGRRSTTAHSAAKPRR